MSDKPNDGEPKSIVPQYQPSDGYRAETVYSHLGRKLFDVSFHQSEAEIILGRMIIKKPYLRIALKVKTNVAEEAGVNHLWDETKKEALQWMESQPNNIAFSLIRSLLNGSFNRPKP